MKEERKSKVAGIRTKVARNEEEVEGRVGAELERKGREEETRGRRKARRNDRANNAHIGLGVRTTNN